MIENVASLLQGIMIEETKKLDMYNLKHAPTIGKMYEGLTSDILEKSIPLNLNLQFVHGVIHNGLGQMTGEIDCMLVQGEGEPIPYTSSYKWHIKDVIAVIEVKKTLYQNDLVDSFGHLRDVLKNHTSYIESTSNEGTFDVSSSLRAFAETTGVIAPSYNDIKTLPIEQQFIYHTLITEQLSPIRIVIGYHGYKSEKALRDSMRDFLSKNLQSKGFGINSFPQLIISGNFSLVKMNGQPYSAPMQTEYWDFFTSSRANPILLILELFWTRLSRNNQIGNFWGEDLTSENFSLFLSGKIRKQNDQFGWEYRHHDFDHKTLSIQPATKEWEPTYVSNSQFVIFNQLCGGDTVCIDDHELITYLEQEGENPLDFFNSLVRTGLVAIRDKELRLTTEQCQCAILPNGKYAVAENNSGRFTNWVHKHFR
ncbi:MAG: hypothetical protein RBT52_03680 [Sulfurimonas sp.]|jgi:hypothetical protein|nr:hypothetical protein [Sulfurimonas sp.]